MESDSEYFVDKKKDKMDEDIIGKIETNLSKLLLLKSRNKTQSPRTYDSLVLQFCSGKQWARYQRFNNMYILTLCCID